MPPRPKDEPNGECLEKGLPCWTCTSSDAVARYSDPERLHCFSCGKTKFINPDGATSRVTVQASPVAQGLQEVIASGALRAIPSRHLTEATCHKFGYTVRKRKGRLQHLAVYRKPDGTPVGVKIRDTGEDGSEKEFAWVGDSKDQLFGRHLWSAGGRMLVICEGEIDTLTVSQAQNNQYPVVGIPNGAPEASRAIAKNLDWVNTFEKVIIGFDMDSQGQEAALACAALLPPGKAFIAKWTAKDPNAMLQQGQGEAITRCIWNADPYRPDGILDIRKVTMEPPAMGTPWAYRVLTRWTIGRRGGEVYTIGAGSGLGKTDFLAETIAATIAGTTREGDTFAPEGFALFAYESGAAQTKQAILGKLVAKRFQFPQGHPDCGWTQEDLIRAETHLDACWASGGKCFILDSKGAADWERSKDLARFLHHSEGITNFMWDPISALVAGEEDERKMLDQITLEAASLAVELNSKVYLVSHLTRPKEGPTHEEGGRVKLGQFRGSNGIGMYSNFVFGLERNQQADTEVERCTTTIRAVKDRLTGNSTGETFKLHYDRITGTLDMAYEEVPQEDEA